MNLPDEVIDTIMDGVTVEAVETGAKALTRTWLGPDVNGRTTVLAGTVVDHAGPVIADYAYRKGREDALTEARAEIEKHLEMEADIAADYASPEYGRGVVTGYQSALSSLAGEEEADEDAAYWPACRRCKGEGRIDLRWLSSETFVAGSGRVCPSCGGSGEGPEGGYDSSPGGAGSGKERTND